MPDIFNGLFNLFKPGIENSYLDIRMMLRLFTNCYSDQDIEVLHEFKGTVES